MTTLCVKGRDKKFPPIKRRSWYPLALWIKFPAAINSKALKKACAIKWKKVKEKNWKPIPVIITPSCLKVDKATIFFMSDSMRALKLAIIIVKAPKRLISIKILAWINKKDWNRIKR